MTADAEEWGTASFAVNEREFRALLPTALSACQFPQRDIQDATRTATGTLESRHQNLGISKKTQLKLQWSPAGDGQVAVRWLVKDMTPPHSAFVNPRMMRRVAEVLSSEVDRYRRQPSPAVAHDPVVAPGEPLPAAFTGIPQDYSACATLEELQPFRQGTLPLGCYAAVGRRSAGPPVPLFLPPGRSGTPKEWEGTLVCAPTNTGKTRLITRWALAANARGYNTFIVDVKGNMLEELAGRLDGPLYYFTTEPSPRRTWHRFNCLNGLQTFTRAENDRIGQLVMALVPGKDPHEDAFHYVNRLQWTKALVRIATLRELWCEKGFDDGRHSVADLGDLYDLATDEELLYTWAADIFELEEATRAAGRGDSMPQFGIQYWMKQIALLIRPDALPFVAGQRPADHSYQQFTAPIRQALEPFARHSELNDRVSGAADADPSDEPMPPAGHAFSLEWLGRETGKPITVLFAAGEHDLGSQAILSLAVKRIEQFLDGRMRQSKGAAVRKILLLLDETRLIREFDVVKFFTYYREAKIGTVAVYQDLTMIRGRDSDPLDRDARIGTVLRNAGTQIYLGSLDRSTLAHFNKLLKRRLRAIPAPPQHTLTPDGATITSGVREEEGDFLHPNDTFELSGGRYPALVYVRDCAPRKPVLVDMDEGIAPDGEAS